MLNKFHYMNKLLPIIIILLSFIFGQSESKCGIIPDNELYASRDNQNWGYSSDSLLVDLNRWGQNPFVIIDSLGASVQNRALWELTITNHPESTTLPRIYIHTRTHPGEEESFWVVNEIINILLSDDPYANFIRDNTIFHIIPMYNPDGVELGFPRENANGIDIESGWDDNPLEPEVAVLQNRFSELMFINNPIKVALNMHAAYACYRYFVYHDSFGSSENYSILEQNYINKVQSYFMSGIEPWSHYISWTNGTPDQYPESWWWANFGENVLALTYEDMNSCENSGLYDSTANAIVRGTLDYLGIELTEIEKYIISPIHIELISAFPNPFNPATTIQFNFKGNTKRTIYLQVYNINGQMVESLLYKNLAPGEHQINWNASNNPSGVYFVLLSDGTQTKTLKLVLMK